MQRKVFWICCCSSTAISLSFTLYIVTPVMPLQELCEKCSACWNFWVGYGINSTITWKVVGSYLTLSCSNWVWDEYPDFSMTATAHELEEIQSKFFWGTCFGNVRPFRSAPYRLPEIYGCQGIVLSWSLSILSAVLRRVLPTNVILQLTCKRRESHWFFKPALTAVQIRLFEYV